MNKDIDYKLHEGRSIHLVAIDQWGTYEGLLEGVPTSEMNKRIISDAIAKTKERYKVSPYLIKPIETPIQMDVKYPFGNPASIPAITCIGNFNCRIVARDKKMDASMMPVVWFQQDFAFPVDNKILSEIELIPWSRLATDYQY